MIGSLRKKEGQQPKQKTQVSSLEEKNAQRASKEGKPLACVEKCSLYRRLYVLDTSGKCTQEADGLSFKNRTVFIYNNCDGNRL
jgi:hypothetical protein